MKEDLQKFVNGSLLRGSEQVDSNESLLERGVIDSVGLMQLIEFIEDRTGLRIPDQLLVPENFRSVDAMDEMIQNLRNP